MTEMNTSLMNSISSNHFLRDCIEMAIDGFLFRGVTPSDHYYRFAQSFPKAFTLSSYPSNSIGTVNLTTPKQQSHRYHHSSSSSTKHSTNQHQRTANVPLLDLSSCTSNVLLEQQPVSTILSTTTNSGLTIKPKKPVYSPKDSLSSSSNTERRSGNGRRPNSSSIKNPLVTSNSPNTPLSSNDQSPASQMINPKRPSSISSPSADIWNSPQQQQLNSLEIEARDIQERMAKHRSRHSRPNDLSQMTSKQIYDEKCDMQQELLRFENKYSKPTTSEQKRIMKPLYDYYRQLKRLVEKQQST